MKEWKKEPITVDGMAGVLWGRKQWMFTALTGEVDLTNLFEYVLKSKGLAD